MHGYLEKELTQLRMEIDQDAEMADDESCAGAVRSHLLARVSCSSDAFDSRPKPKRS